MPAKEIIRLQSDRRATVRQWKVTVGTTLYEGRIVLLYEEEENEDGAPENKEGDAAQPKKKPKCVKLKSKRVGTVSKLCVKEGDVVTPGSPLFEIDLGCSHPVVINELCAECGADLQKEETVPPVGCGIGGGGSELRNPAASAHPSSAATIPMVHSIPQLKVSHEQAQQLGRADTERLLKEKKLVLLVDLDQTLIHTTHDNIPNNLKDVHHFQLFGSQNPWYHTRLRPGTNRFLTEMYKYYELHICTFGVRPYAHMVAHILDKDAKLFSNRILSRDECFDYNSKVANLQALFPCGDELVCIIDDREDVWNFSGNLIPVKPYHFFKNTGCDINDPNLPPAVKTLHFFAKGVKLKTKKGEVVTVPACPTTNNVSDAKKEEPNEHEEKKIKNWEEELTPEELEEEIKREEKRMRIDDTSGEEETEKDESGHEGDGSDISVGVGEATVKNKKKNTEKKIEDLLVDEEEDEEEEVKAEEELPEEDVLDVEDEDDYLLYLEVILKQVHSLFYKIYNKEEEGIADVKWVIKELKSRVLRGCRVVFSGLVPVANNGLDNSNNSNGKRGGAVKGGDIAKGSVAGEGWSQLAKGLGAQVDLDIVPGVTTHLVAANPTTFKVHKAKKMKGVHVVKPKWLITCAHRWERVEERLFEYNENGIDSDDDDCTSNMMMMMLMAAPRGALGLGLGPEPKGGGSSEQPEEKVVLSQAVVEAMKDEFEEEFTSTDEDDDEEDEEEDKKAGAVGGRAVCSRVAEEDEQHRDDDNDDEENDHPDISDFEDMRGSNSEAEDKNEEEEDDEEWSQLAHQIEQGLDESSLGMDFEESDDR